MSAYLRFGILTAFLVLAPALHARADDDASSDGSSDELDAAAQKAQGKSDSRKLKRMCDKGNGEACTVRGYLYEKGLDGLRKNRRTAHDLYEKGCNADYGLGCLLLGRMYYAGDLVERDEAKGIELAKKGCKLGYKPACKIAKQLAKG